MNKKIEINVNELAGVVTLECAFSPREGVTVTVNDMLNIKHIDRIPELVGALERFVLEICRGDSNNAEVH